MGQDSDVSRQPSPVKNCANRRRQNPVGFQLKGFEKSALVFLFQNCFLCLFLLDFCRNGIVASQKTGQGARFNITTAFKSNSNSNASLFSTSSFLQPQQDEPPLIQEEEVFHLLLKERVMGHTPPRLPSPAFYTATGRVFRGCSCRTFSSLALWLSLQSFPSPLLLPPSILLPLLLP